ncbi:MAG: ferritin-like domain-containing protein [Rhodoferax sp.]|nr:ferritin-like domain-containing protein [Rhodoferax sp.]
MKSSEKHVMDWLRDAHAMEEQSERMLTGTAGQLEHYPQLQERLRLYATEAHQQANLVHECIVRRGGDTSLFKEMAAKVAATAQSVSGVFASDEVAKAVLSIYAFKHMEIGSYRMLAAGAQMLGDTQTQNVCERILAQEVAMAEWVAGQLSTVTQQFLQRSDSTADQTAKS